MQAKLQTLVGKVRRYLVENEVGYEEKEATGKWVQFTMSYGVNNGSLDLFVFPFPFSDGSRCVVAGYSKPNTGAPIFFAEVWRCDKPPFPTRIEEIVKALRL